MLSWRHRRSCRRRRRKTKWVRRKTKWVRRKTKWVRRRKKKGGVGGGEGGKEPDRVNGVKASKMAPETLRWGRRKKRENRGKEKIP